MSWALSLSGFYPKWMSVTVWENDKEGRPPMRCYIITITIATFLALLMIVQGIVSPTSVPVVNVLLFATILSAVAYYVVVGVVQIAFALNVEGPANVGDGQGERYSTVKRTVGLVRGIVLVVANVFVIVMQVVYDEISRTSAIVVTCVMTAAC
ncbi:hypothetical protein HDU97_009846, partial [Phlyctochytrium planicorne]